MTIKEQRIALLELDGWKRMKPFKCGRDTVDWPVWEKEGKRISFKTNSIPYLTLDLLHEARKKFNDDQMKTYGGWISHIVLGAISGHDGDRGLFAIANADVKQHLEAHLRTFGLFK